jgi:hypothetical protein
MKYAVIVCPHCQTGKIIEQKHQTTRCIRCGKQLIIKKIKIHYQTDILKKAQQALGQINAEKDDHLEEFKTFIKQDLN